MGLDDGQTVHLREAEPQMSGSNAEEPASCCPKYVLTEGSKPADQGLRSSIQRVCTHDSDQREGIFSAVGP